MNIFATSPCPVISARSLPKIHVVKMILESYQILSTIHFKYTGKVTGYKPTHSNHPSTIWAGACVDNYNWLYVHVTALSDLYKELTGNIHKSHSELSDLLRTPPDNIPLTTFVYTPNKPTPAMPDHFKGDYQKYLNCKYSQWIKEGNKRILKGLVWEQGYPDWLCTDVINGCEKS